LDLPQTEARGLMRVNEGEHFAKRLDLTNLAAQTATAGDESQDVRKSVQAFYDAYNAHEFDKLTQFTTEDWTHIAPAFAAAFPRR
jgi:hypothetical protein